jgi:hypothetical protein
MPAILARRPERRSRLGGVAGTTASALRAVDRRAAFETALIVVGFFVLLLVLPHQLIGDDTIRFYDIEQLIHHGHLTDSKFSLVGPLLSAPLLLVGEVVGSPVWWAGRFNLVVVAVGLAVAYGFTRGRIAPGLFRTFALVLLFASFLTDRLRNYGAEPLTAVLFALGALAVVAGRYRLLGWAAMVVGVVNTPAALGALALVAAARALQTRRLRPFLAPAAAVLLIMLESWIRRGGPLTTGYANDHGIKTLMPHSDEPGFSYPFVLGLVSILFSFGRGLVFFMPGLLLWLDRRTRRLVPNREWVSMMLLCVAGLVLVYAKWWAWFGGDSWGPRFFVIGAVPASFLIAVRLCAGDTGAWAAVVTLAVLALSAWVGVTGALENSWLTGFCSQNNYQLAFACWYVPDFSGLWWPVTHHPGPSAANLFLTGYCFLVFAYLAIGPLREIARALATVPATLAHGWRF